MNPIKFIVYRFKNSQIQKLICVII